MSDKDKQLLIALADRGGQGFQQVIRELTREAGQVALGLFTGDDTKIDEAVSEAINKVSDWLGTGEPLKVRYPFAYAKSMVHNKVIDYGKAHKHVGPMSSTELRKELAGLIDGFGYWGEHDEEDIREGTKGWRGVRYDGKSKRVKLDVPYPEHHLLRALSCKWEHWFFSDGTKKACDRRWGKYKLMTALVEGIPGLAEQRIVDRFLRGYRQVDLARELGVTKSHISQVIKKWVAGRWGWDKLEMGMGRVILLTNYLALVYREASLTAEEMIELDRQARRETSDSIAARQRRKSLSRQILQARLYSKITVAPQAQAYFGDLKESDSLGLAQQSARFHGLWYYDPFPEELF